LLRSASLPKFRERANKIHSPGLRGAGRGKNLNELKHAMHLFIVVVEADKD